MTLGKMPSKKLQQTLYLRMKYQKHFLTIKKNSRIFQYYHFYFTQGFSQHKKTRGEYKMYKEWKRRNSLSINVDNILLLYVFVFCFYIRNYHKFSSFKQHTFIILQFYQSELLFSAQDGKRQKPKWGSSAVLSWIVGSFFKLTWLLAGVSSL